MKTQNQIKRTLTRPEAIEYVKHVIGTSGSINRTQLADHLCDKYEFIDPQGQKQRSGCLVAIRELERKEYYVLPAPSRSAPKNQPKRLDCPVPDPVNVPDKVGKIEVLRLIQVETEEHTKIWNELLIREHPRKSTIFFGRQIRYLVQSEHGWLGAIGFASSALHLEGRDKWIGWDSDTRKKHLHRVVNMSRFLIRPGISCKNLASRVPGMAARQFPNDFKTRYALTPLLLESFIDTDLHLGTCYKAANWHLVGQTKGRGRQGQSSDLPETIKDIYMYPLTTDFRSEFGLPEGSGYQEHQLEAIEITSGIDCDHWAENEFGGAPVGDKRVAARLILSAKDLAQNPGMSYGPAVSGDWSKTKGYYRMIDKPDDSVFNMENILLPHKERTMQRMKDQEVVLCLQDGSKLNYSHLPTCEGLGFIAANQTSAKTKGLHLHSTLAVSNEGLPLGIIRAECTAPEKKDNAKRKKLSNIPIEEKNTFCWLESVRECEQIKKQMPGTTIVNVMDREGDFFELFDDQRLNCKNVELLVRAKHNRKVVGEDNNLFELVKKTPCRSRLQIKVPRQSARPKRSKQKARQARSMRTVEVSVHHQQVKLNPPRAGLNKGKPPISVWIVCATETFPPEGLKPVEWFLLTTVKIESVNDAIECVRRYCLRWRIEDWHRVLKSGCNIEKKAHKTAERLKRSIAINMVIGWRIMLMTLLGREVPELPPEVVFTDLELEVMLAYSKK